MVGVGRAQNCVLLIVGMLYMAEAIEIVMLSYVVISLRDAWALTPTEESFISLATFLGSVVGAPFWGSVADKYGRRPALIAVTGVVSVFGFITSMCVSVATFFIARFGVGFGVGGLLVAFDILSEVCPPADRGHLVMRLMVFWAGATLFSNLLAWLLLSSAGWRVYVALSSMPAVIAFVSSCVSLLESPMWLLAVGREKESIETLCGLACMNERSFDVKSIVVRNGKCGGFADLCKRKHVGNLLVITTILFAVNFSFYGILMLLPRFFVTRGAAEEETQGGFDFLALTVGGLSEFLGSWLGYYIIDKGHRLRYYIMSISLSGLCTVMLTNGGLSDRVLVAISFVDRALMYFVFCLLVFHAGEMFPTRIRATSHCLVNMGGKLGACVAMFAVSDSLPLYTAMRLLAFCWLIPLVLVPFLPDTDCRSINDMDSTEEEEQEET
eukprot:TRINITY_DN22819_c0_g1_i2.p1 TRINITY_DN22819_c0_g1~~TRINITY_DN22819_c0_g1_i2.p1  ORF type:complete len:494 (+),score=46.25 TRINITY_DN22819_c0_g1_i2:165-1484(+)